MAICCFKWHSKPDKYLQKQSKYIAEAMLLVARRMDGWVDSWMEGRYKNAYLIKEQNINSYLIQPQILELERIF